MSNPNLIKNFVAESAVLPLRMVKFGAVVPAAAATDAVIGICDEMGQDTAAGRIDVVVSGIADATAGAAITRGAFLVSDATGRVVTAAPGAGANATIVGQAFASAAGAGEIIPVKLSIGSLQG